MGEKEDDPIVGLTNRLVDVSRRHGEIAVGGFGVLKHLWLKL